MDSSGKGSNDFILNNILQIFIDYLEHYVKDNNMNMSNIYDNLSFYLNKFYALTTFDYENKNSDFYNPLSRVKSYPIINETETEFKVRKTIMILFQYVFEIFFSTIDYNRESFKFYLIEDYKFVNKIQNINKNQTMNKEFKEEIIKLINIMMENKNLKINKKEQNCKFFDSPRGCRNGDTCNFKHEGKCEVEIEIEDEGEIKHKKISHFMMNNDI